jgi:hypothetical protein
LNHYLISHEIGKLHGIRVCSLLTLWHDFVKIIKLKKGAKQALAWFFQKKCLNC